MELAIKLLVGILPVIISYLGKVNRPYTIRKLKQKSKAVEDLEFISGFLAFDISKRPRLVVEQAFSAFLGYALNYDQITHILKLNNPSLAFNLLQKSKGYIELKDGVFEWAEKKKRNKTRYIVGYFAFFYIGLYPPLMVFLNDFNLEVDALLILAVWTLMFSGLAFDSLRNL